MIPGMFQNQKKNQKNQDLWQDINSHSINHDIKRAWTCCLLLTELLAFIIKCPHTSLICWWLTKCPTILETPLFFEKNGPLMAYHWNSSKLEFYWLLTIIFYWLWFIESLNISFLLCFNILLAIQSWCDFTFWSKF